VRAMETAALLDLPSAKWYCEFYLRELDKGILAGQSKKEREKNHKVELVRKAMDPFFYAAPGGESVADCCIRIERVLDIMRQSCSGLRVAIVCHGNIMKAFRVRMERMSQSQYFDTFVQSEADDDKIRNCQIIWYTRRNPENHRVSSKFRWMKSVCPWDEQSVKGQGWREINRPNYTNEELLTAVQSVPQVVNYSPGELPEDAYVNPLEKKATPSTEPILLDRRGSASFDVRPAAFLEDSPRGPGPDWEGYKDNAEKGGELHPIRIVPAPKKRKVEVAEHPIGSESD